MEHLNEDALDKFPETLFNCLRPRLVIITTPNAEFNVVFKMKPNQMRHTDHKFEWTRAQFQHWCDLNASKYGYNVTYSGVGDAPQGQEHLGFCTQMAIFTIIDSPVHLSSYEHKIF